MIASRGRLRFDCRPTCANAHYHEAIRHGRNVALIPLKNSLTAGSANTKRARELVINLKANSESQARIHWPGLRENGLSETGSIRRSLAHTRCVERRQF